MRGTLILYWNQLSSTENVAYSVFSFIKIHLNSLGFVSWKCVWKSNETNLIKEVFQLKEDKKDSGSLMYQMNQCSLLCCMSNNRGGLLSPSISLLFQYSVGRGVPPAAPGSRNKSICSFISLCMRVYATTAVHACVLEVLFVLSNVCVCMGGGGTGSFRFLGLLVFAGLCSSGSIWPTTTHPAPPHPTPRPTTTHTHTQLL